MIYDDLKQSYNTAKIELKKAEKYLKPDELLSVVKKCETELQKPEVWQNSDISSKISKELKDAKDQIAQIERWRILLEDVGVFFELYDECKEENVLKEAEKNLKKLNAELEAKEIEKTHGGEYDKDDVIITVNAGAGGTDAQD